MACILPSCLLRVGVETRKDRGDDLVESTSSSRRALEIRAVSVARRKPKLSIVKKKRGPASSKEQLGWEKMMVEVESSTEPAAVLVKYVNDGNVPRENIVGTLTRLKQMKSWKTIIQFTEWLMEQGWYKFNQKDFFLVLLACCKDGQVEKTEKVLARMKDFGIPASIEMFTLQIEAYGRIRDFQKAEAIFQKLQSSGPQPTALTYQTLMRAYSEAGRLEDVQRVFQLVNSAGNSHVKPDARMYNLMIHTYGKLGKVQEAMSVYQAMKRDRVAVTVVTFNSLLAIQKTWRDAEDIFKKLRAANVDPDTFTYTTLLNAYAKARRVESAQAVFDEMIGAGVKPTQVAYNALINAYAKCKDPEGARRVLKEMKQSGCIPTVESYTALVSAYASVNLMAKAEQVVLRMKEAGVRPNMQTFCVLMSGYANANKLEFMMRTFDKMKLAGLEPNKFVYTVLVNAYGSSDDFDSAVIWFKQMLDDGYQADPVMKTVLQKIAKSPEQRAEVQELLRGMLGAVDVDVDEETENCRTLEMTTDLDESCLDRATLETSNPVTSLDVLEEEDWIPEWDDGISEEQEGLSFPAVVAIGSFAGDSSLDRPPLLHTR